MGLESQSAGCPRRAHLVERNSFRSERIEIRSTWLRLGRVRNLSSDAQSDSHRRRTAGPRGTGHARVPPSHQAAASRRCAGRPTPKAGRRTSSRTPTNPTATSASRSIWPRPWRRNSAGGSSSCSTTSTAWCRACSGGDFDFAMNGLEVTPDRRKRRPLQPAVLRLHAATGRPGRRDAVRVARTSAGQRAAWSARWKTRPPTAAGPAGRRARGSTTTRSSRTWTWSWAGSTPCCWTCRSRCYYAKPNPKLKFVGPAAGAGLLRDRVPQGAGGSWPRSSTPRWQRLADSGELRRIYEKWGFWNDDQAAPVRRRAGRRRPAPSRGRRGRSADYLPLLLQGPW